MKDRKRIQTTDRRDGKRSPQAKQRSRDRRNARRLKHATR